MNTLTNQLPDSLKKSIEVLAGGEGYSVSQFLASAASAKLAVVLTIDYLPIGPTFPRRFRPARPGEGSPHGSADHLTEEIEPCFSQTPCVAWAIPLCYGAKVPSG